MTGHKSNKYKMIKKIDFILKDIGELVNPFSDDFVRGKSASELRVSKGKSIASYQGKIVYIGDYDYIKDNFEINPDTQIMDASKRVVMPGFVDAHNHLPFGGTREDEFKRKLQGVSYQQIAKEGGGIKSTVKWTREATPEALYKQCMWRLDAMLMSGTTSSEAKSGYGLNKESEIKQLEVLKELDKNHPISIFPTFMGAHEIPDEFKGDNKGFLDYLINELLPVVKERNLSDIADIFCENGYFTYEDAKYYLGKAKEMGFKLKMHAAEFTSNDGVKLAVDLGAISSEHLIAMSEEEILAISKSQTAAVLLPSVSFFLKMKEYAPAQRLIEEDGIVALGSDFNPGSSMNSSMLFTFQLGIFALGMTIEESFNASTINAAYACRREKECGSLDVGKNMDLLILGIPSYSYLAYHLGINPIETIIKKGKVVLEKGRLKY